MYFRNLRDFLKEWSEPINMALILDWQAHTHVQLERWERECIFAMDRSFRHAYGEVLHYHASRPQVGALKNGGRDWQKAHQ